MGEDARGRRTGCLFMRASIVTQVQLGTDWVLRVDWLPKRDDPLGSWQMAAGDWA